MSLLNITNLTENPEEWIEDKYNCAFEELGKEFNITISESEKSDFIDNRIENLEEEMEEAQGRDLLCIIDNYLVNFDYYAEVKDWYENNK